MNKTEQKTILIVDDQPENLKVIVDMFLEECKMYDIIKAPNGKVALKIIDKVLPDVIITDWEMPEMGGIELIQNLQKNKHTVDIPIIMCTGIMTSSENLKTALNAGAIDYIRKPIDNIELIARTNSALMLAESRQEIIQKNKQLGKHIKTKDKFFSIIAHDLRGPLINLSSLGELLSDRHTKIDVAKRDKLMNLLTQSAKDSFNLLENLLKWARSNSGNMEYNPKEIILNDLFKKNLSFFEQTAELKKITLKCSFNEKLKVYADYEMTNTILRNLLSNAIKFTPQNGSVEIVYRNISTSELEIGVVDSGVGIEKEILTNLLNLESEYTSIGTNNERGSGLGLKLCKEFVTKNKGKMRVESEIDKGSKFWFSLPLIKA